MSGSSDKVREVAAKRFVRKLRDRGTTEFSLAVREVKQELEKEGFPSNNTPQICSALRSRRFLQEQNLELIGADGPKSMQSTTVVYHYRFRDSGVNPGRNGNGDKCPDAESRWRAFEEASGSLHDVFAEFGGGEKFLEWVRTGMDRQI